jgi:DNA (cytosine-5)-methyltransferase 1
LAGYLLASRSDNLYTPDIKTAYKPTDSLELSMSVNTFTVVSLFIGAGGLDLGLEQAGFRTVSAVDNDPNCVRTLLDNQAARIRHGDGPAYLEVARILQAGIETLKPADLRPPAADRNWVPDLMAGGPPCQPFSSSGKMLSVSDPRGRLFQDFVRIAQGLKPKLILFENVRGMVTARGPKGEPGEVLDTVRRAFEDIGYATTFALLNAADYGCPQRRVRCFMMATRCTRLPEFPEATHSESPEAGGLFGASAKWVALGDYLASLPPPSDDEIVRPTERLAAQLAHVAAGSGLKSAGAREATRPGGHWGYRQGTFIADLTQPARTITASASQDWVRLPAGSLRRLTLRECAGLQGFPSEWQFAGPLASKFRQVGNAVPTIFGWIIGRALVEALKGGQQPRPRSARFPRDFEDAIAYTRREQAKNGESRRRARERLSQPGIDLRVVKGLGSAGLANE